MRRLVDWKQRLQPEHALAHKHSYENGAEIRQTGWGSAVFEHEPATHCLILVAVGSCNGLRRVPR